MTQSTSRQSHQPPQEHQLPEPILNMSLQPSSPSSISLKPIDSYTPTDRLSLLPAEMKVALLISIPDLTTLRTLTLSIPSFYTIYKSQQRHILFHVISNDLSSEMLGEACSLHTADSIRRDERSWARKTRQFIIDYEVDRTLGVRLYDQDLDTLRKMAIFHLNVQKIAEKHVHWAMANRPNISDSTVCTIAPLSSTEKTRIYRGYYHFDIFAALFGRTPQAPKRVNINLRTVYHNHVDALLQSYEEWEVEESNCVRHFIHCIYQDLIKRHAASLGVKFDETMVKNGKRMVVATPFPQYIFQYEDALFRDLANHLTALGLPFLLSILSCTTPAEELTLLLTNAYLSSMTSPRPSANTAGQYLTWPHLDERISWFPPMPPRLTFCGDDLEKPGPNIGIIWTRTYIDGLRTFGSVGSSEGWSGWLLGWGFAFWDFERVDGWGILRSNPSSFHGVVKEFGKMWRAGGGGVVEEAGNWARR